MVDDDSSDGVLLRTLKEEVDGGGDALYRSLVESLREHAVFALSLSGDIVTWNSGAQHTYGYAAREIVGQPFSITFTRADIAAGAPERELAEARHTNRRSNERWNVRKDGRLFWATTTIAPIYGQANTLLGFTKFVADMTEAYHARKALEQSEEYLRLIIESVPDYAIFSLALDGSIASWNAAAHRALGYAEDEIVGKHFAQLFSDDDVANGVPDLVIRKAMALGSLAEERWFIRKDGSRFLGSERIGRLKPGSSNISGGLVHIAYDITEHKTITEEWRRRASFDPLTELPNRAKFLEYVERAMAALKRRSSNLFAVMFIDLDHFKEVNDTYGHSVADRLLEITARRLEQCARTEDIVGRIGGDEFAILVNGIHDVADANDAADRIRVEMEQPAAVDAHHVRATASIGIALGTPRYERAEDILRDADTAMYVAKAGGRARSMLFTNALVRGTQEDFDLIGDLRHAVERNELRVVYQPLIHLSDGTIAGFEALVRWQHPRRGLLEPSAFILKAEASELIIALDRFVIHEACRSLARWRERCANPDLSMSVNLSAKQFSHPGLLAYLQHVLDSTDLPSRCVHLEITESTVIEQSNRTAAVLAAIVDAGFELHVDDFGVGYSSLALLRELPLHALKIDRSFVSAMHTRNGAELIRTIIGLAHNLGLVAIAEGIETTLQAETLQSIGCDYGQGYLLSAPLTGDDVEPLIAERRGSVTW